MSTRQARFWVGVALVVVFGSLATAFIGSGTWRVFTTLGLLNFGVAISNYRIARQRERTDAELGANADTSPSVQGHH